jgi:predicted DNA-binding protein with PD1-like motif
MDKGDEISQVLKDFAASRKLRGSSFKAIGALSYAKLGWFNWQTKKYEVAVELDEQVELLSLIGDVALKDGDPQVHAHMIIGRRDGSAHGGHLLKAVVRPTCELILSENSEAMQKELDPETGLALIRL